MPRPPRPWFRFYSETLTSRKAQELGRSRPDLYFHWVNLLCLANVQIPRGSLPSIEDIAFGLRVSDGEVGGIMAALQQAKFIDRKRGRWEMHDWEEWQYESDLNQTPGRKTRSHGTPKERDRNAESPPKERTESEAEAEADTEAEAESDADALPSHPFAVLYSKNHRALTGKILTPAVHGRALTLEGKYGAALCIDVAEEKGWEKHPNYYVDALEERVNGKQLQAPVRANGRTPIPDAADELERRLSQL